ncbi:archaeosortase A [Methanoplanus sp. FWC-SCC4]|uniref:Archaeosortase A n=1 Tax=Methanochimaera problematica TaxID=2609417 RepID=A0AA97I3B4_9EURY|nr:archaeosortase A [Methanoplanus sp. FWC-SCC4]WOF17175.1 archaeosortase A [Methanoplanus sp. FWC-SCC4]
MEAILATVSFICFVIFLLPIKTRNYFAIIAWSCLLASVFANFPKYIYENNIAYPALALISIPLLLITARNILKENETVLAVTKGTAVAFLIFAPFAYVEQIGNLLIFANVEVISFILDSIGFTYTMSAPDMFLHDIFQVEIILACTGIQAIAIMLGLTFAIPSTTRQKALSIAVVVPVIVIMNLFRSLFVIITYTEQWFPYFPEIASNGNYGYESFFWAHNIISEFGISLITIIIVIYTLILINPGIKDFMAKTLSLYIGELRQMAGKNNP